MADLVALARAAEGRDGVLAATVFGGFALSDIAEAGLSLVTVAESEAAAAEAAERIAAAAWARRAEFVYHEAPLAESIAAARRAFAQAGGPVLMLDHGDNCMSGGTCDVMDVLEAALAAGCEGVLAGPIADPQAVEALRHAGVGATIELGIGNKVAAPGFASRPPLRLAGVVEALSEGVYTVSGPIYTGQTFSMGRAAVLRTPQARVLVTERPHEPWDLGVFACAGLDPRQADYLILKSRMYCRPGVRAPGDGDDRMRQRRRHQLQLRPVHLHPSRPARLSAGAAGRLGRAVEPLPIGLSHRYCERSEAIHASTGPRLPANLRSPRDGLLRFARDDGVPIQSVKFLL